jgi:cysteine desulfurase
MDREDFVYMDYNATTPVRGEVAERLRELTERVYGNASSVHWAGREAKRVLDESRERVAAVLGVRPSEVVFTGGGSESDNLAIKGIAWARGKGRIVTSAIKHPAVLETCRFLASRGFEVVEVPPRPNGRVDVDAFAEAIDDSSVLVSLMWANNETGVLQPVEEVAELARSRGVPFHTDAVQAFGKVAVDLRRVPADLVALSGHKFYAPKGVGVLIVRRGLLPEPLVHGGGQEKGRRSGTENVPAIGAFALACELAAEEVESEARRIGALRDRLERSILEKIPGARVNGADAPRVPNTSNVTFEGVEAEAILVSLDEAGVGVSSASACAAGHTDPSHVLTAMGMSREEAEGTLRFSLGLWSSDAHVDRVVEVLPGIVDRLRRLSA